jgi:hypothetical protein
MTHITTDTYWRRGVAGAKPTGEEFPEGA